MSEHVDVIVIGAGQAGPALAARCGREGLKTIIIEREHMGGTCVNNGCIPTKTLVASARVAALARRAAEFGVVLDQPPRVDMKAVKARKDKIVEASRTGVGNWMAQAKNVSVVHGNARFIGPRDIEVEGRHITAERIFINVGGRPAVPKLSGLDGVPYLNNISMMDVDFVPPHLIVVGGSYIGLEFAQMYRRFGAEVTVCEMGPRLIGREDEDISAEVRAILEREGIMVRVGASCLAVEPTASGVSLGVDCDESSGVPKVEGSHLLLATGRVPNTDDLGLDRAGIAVDTRGYVVVDDQLQTNVPGVYALGDVNGRGAFTHTSWNDYEIVAANLFDGEHRKVTDRIPVYALFTDPPLGRVGMSFDEARKTGRPLLGAKMLMTRVGRARESGETQGFMKIVVDAETKRILGASLLGLSADEVVQSILEVMVADKPYTQINRGMHIHPTVTELVPTLLEGLKPLS
ncbi:MAG: FAD-containing oxidoreductase [Aeromicrobium sp.]|nr:FAD-containing oxidoreductase [Burkholderiales bacterium]